MSNEFTIPAGLRNLEDSERGRAWLRELPAHLAACVAKWGLTLEVPYEQSCVSIVFPVSRADGSAAVLKVQYPHPESDHETEALRQWKGNGAILLYDDDPEHHALLLERCQPGDHLARVAADGALEIIAGLLPRLWIKAGRPFRSVGEEAAGWCRELPVNWERAGRPFEMALLETAIEGMERLSGSQGEQVLVHQDLHGDNVLRATREPWLVIDPKPLVGEKEFSLAPIIRSYEFGHSRRAVVGRLDRLTSMLGLDRERVRLWTIGQTLAWAFEGSVAFEKHVETARWLWEA
jgi:streptomycin 6-kinase